MSQLDTADNPALIGKLLQEIRQMLVKDYGHKTIRALEDKRAIYAFIMRDQYDGRYILIAKGSKLYRDIVSAQNFLPQQAARENTPLVLVWRDPESGVVRYYLFDPQEIVDKNYGTNERFGVMMLNWSIRLGVRYDPSSSVSELYQKTRKRKQGLLGFGILDGSIFENT